MYDGHQFHKIGSSWVFDMTTYKGYRVTINPNGKVESFELGYKVKEDEEVELNVEKYSKIPLAVLRKTYRAIKEHNRRAFLNG